jgi:6-phosphofructokinase 1
MKKYVLLAGPRRNLYFQPSNVNAAIVCLGGVCPGMNVMVSDIFYALRNNYHVNVIYGIRCGFVGAYQRFTK